MSGQDPLADGLLLSPWVDAKDSGHPETMSLSELPGTFPLAPYI
jgi:hypothetical protein